MSRTNIDIDDALIAEVMSRFGFRTKREAVEYALRTVRNEAFTTDQIMALAGTNFWDGDPAAAGLDPVEFPELFEKAGKSA